MGFHESIYIRCRYFKNLSTDKVNFSTIKGEGEVADLELDEIALTDLLDLPAWMRITSAKCNKVTFQIPWTKLKSEPMIWVCIFELFYRFIEFLNILH